MTVPTSGNSENKHSDESLVQLLQDDHEWALKEIFSRHHLRLYRLATSILHDSDLAKDIVQEVFIDLWNRRHTSQIRQLSGYLLRAVKFQVLNQLRNGKLREHHLQMVEQVEFINQTEEAINFKETEHALKESLNQLPPRCRQVFFLSRFEYLSNKEISKRLNISSKTVEVQITKALAFLRANFEKSISVLISALFL
jgi:RNA polymerase sigma-70 factor (family 1)